MYDYLIVGSGLYGSIFAREATDKGYKVKAEKYTIGRKVGPKTFVPVKMDIGDFVLLPQAMTIMDIIDLRESLEKEGTA